MINFAFLIQLELHLRCDKLVRVNETKYSGRSIILLIIRSDRVKVRHLELIRSHLIWTLLSI